MLIRWAIKRDIPALLAIEEASFDTPWNAAEFTKAITNASVVCKVGEINEQVVGFIVYELHKKKFHVASFAVAPDHRKQGVGRQLMQHLISMLNEERTRITMEVREKNLAAQKFCKAIGFKALRVLRDYYPDGEAAYLFSWFGTFEEDLLDVELEELDSIGQNG